VLYGRSGGNMSHATYGKYEVNKKIIRIEKSIINKAAKKNELPLLLGRITSEEGINLLTKKLKGDK
jgi:hypothetical protein